MSRAKVTRVGRYEIIELIGEGGMGRVFKALDTQLARTVAIKVLPAAFSTNQESLRRFEQEARATAALNHPGIMAVYDVGVHEGAPYLVSEFLEGATLRDRLAAGRLPVHTALDFATQIAEALAVAHAKGIVHRDLKPENVFVCAGDRLKILDFGLAKLTVAQPALSARADVTGALPDTILATVPNTILGTPTYMPPEQARGESADHRADIFSFGCILYEMLEGHRAFDGKTAADVIGSVLKDEPAALTSSVDRPLPRVLDRIVWRCIAKDPAARFQSASDLAFALQSLSPEGVADASGTLPIKSPAPESRPLLLWILGGAAVASLLAAVFMWTSLGRSAAGRPAAVAEFLVPTPAADQSFAPLPLPGLLPTAPQVGLSPDGRQLAFVTTDPAGRRRLWIRSIETSRPRLVEGADGAASWPFWSPDSRYVVVAVGKALMKVDTRGTSIERLTTLPDQTPPTPFVTGFWSEDGTILFSVGGRTGLYALPAAGGSPRLVTTLDSQRGDHYHSWPQRLQDAKFLVFVRTDNPETNGTYAGSLESTTLTKVHANPTRAVYAAGHLLWAIEDRLVAQAFDSSRLQLSGQPATIAPSVFQGAGRTPGFWSASTDTIVYSPGDTRERQFRWFSREGSPLESVGPPGLFVTFDVSKDLSKVVVEVSKDPSARYSTLALLDIARGILTPLTLGDQNDSDPRFGPDGDIVFARNSRESPGILRINPGSRQVSTLMPRGPLLVMWLEDWPDDGSSIVYRTGANLDAWQQTAATEEPRKLTDAREPIEQVQLSPDLRWIAYNTAESGQSEVFVSSVPFGGERRQVSSAGGVQPTWRADGRELYYLGLDGGLYSVSLDPKRQPPGAGAPQLLFRTTLPVISAVVEQYRPSDDGRRFLFCQPLTSVRHEPLRLLLNWQGKLVQPAEQR